MDRMSRTRLDLDVDTAHLTQVMRRFAVSDAGEAVAVALRLAASPPLPGDPASGRRDTDTVEELVSVESLHRSMCS